MPDARLGHGTPIDLDKLRSLPVGRIHRDRVTEGRAYRETGHPSGSTAATGQSG